MIAGIADTHTALWHLYADSRLSTRARAFIEDAARNGNKIGICTISLAEIVYLVEKRRVLADAYTDLTGVLDDTEQVFELVTLTREIVASMRSVARDEVPDLPDRIVAATAAHFRVPVVSRDGRIQTSAVASIW